MKQAPLVDLNSEMISLSSSATSSSSSSSLCTSSHSSHPHGQRSSVSVLRPSYMLQSLSEYVSPSLSKAFFSSASSTSSSSNTTTTNEEKTATLTPFNSHQQSIPANTTSRHASFTGKILMRHEKKKKKKRCSTNDLNDLWFDCSYHRSRPFIDQTHWTTIGGFCTFRTHSESEVQAQTWTKRIWITAIVFTQDRTTDLCRLDQFD